MRYTRILSGGVVVLTLLLVGCSKDEPTNPSMAGRYDGASAPLGQGKITACEYLDASGELTSVALRMDESVLTGLPTEDTQIELALPMKGAHSPFTHMLVDWNPHGHTPPGVYDVPHFDFHFYMISSAERKTVVAGPDTIPVPADYIPAGYISTQEAVPGMGTHWVDVTSPEFHGTPFDKTFIYGEYHGHITFLEPMITKAYIETKPNVTVDIKQPAKFERTGYYYPLTYSVTYDATAKQYQISIGSMKMH